MQVALDFTRPTGPFVLAAFGANLAAAFLEGGSIGAVMMAFRSFGSAANGRLFLGLVLLAISAQILRVFFQFAGLVATAYLQTRVQAEAHHRLFQRFMDLPFPRASSYPPGGLPHALRQVTHLNEALAHMNVSIKNFLLVGMGAFVLLWLSWPLTLVVLAAYGVIAWPLRRMMARIHLHASRFSSADAILYQRTTEYLQALRLFHSFARQKEAVQSVKAMTAEWMASHQRATLWGVAVEPVFEGLTLLGTGALLVVGTLILGEETPAVFPPLLVFLLALHRMTPRLAALQGGLAALANLSPRLLKIQEFLLEPAEGSQEEAKTLFSGLRDGIEFRQVALRYRNEEPPAVRDLSFRIPEGSFTAIVGRSGSGKSTIADLLVGLWEAAEGEILIDGVNLKQIHRASWRQRLGVVAQETFLFHATLRENIGFAWPEASQQEIVAAAKAAYAHEFILGLPRGYETVGGDRGVQLSGGQRQRIALARALLRRPEILILDEATSALDSESERLIQRALEERRGKQTVIAIAHRLSTVAHADQILVLAEGRLVEEGTHASLLKRGGIYAHLWRLQSEDQNREISVGPAPLPPPLRV